MYDINFFIIFNGITHRFVLLNIYGLFVNEKHICFHFVVTVIRRLSKQNEFIKMRIRIKQYSRNDGVDVVFFFNL